MRSFQIVFTPSKDTYRGITLPWLVLAIVLTKVLTEVLCTCLVNMYIKSGPQLLSALGHRGESILLN